MKIREVQCKRWFLSDWVAAITLYPFIFYNTSHRLYKYDFPALRVHEYVHIKQVRQYGWLKFYLTYLYQNLRYGYQGNKYEVEARKEEARFRNL